MTNLVHTIGPARRASNCRAFTLVEITMVVVILAILAAIALPGLASQNDLTLSAASRVVIGDLLYVQSQAVATGQNQSVTFVVATGQTDQAEGSYSSTVISPITQMSIAQTFGTGSNSPLAGVALADLTLDAPANTVLTFGPLGQPMVGAVSATPVSLASTGTIVLQCGMDTVTLSIEPDTGNITVSKVTQN